MLSEAKHLGKLCETLRFAQGDKLKFCEWEIWK